MPVIPSTASPRGGLQTCKGRRKSSVPPGVFLEIADIGDMPFVERTIATHEIEAVLHFAASCVVPDSVEKPLEYYRNNTVNSVHLIDACVRSGVRHFIFSSTAAV